MALPVRPGDVIGGSYVIERLLGQGGMGAVFVAREERLGRHVAIKVLLDTIASTPEALVRFEREARSAAALQSDHVTRVLSVGQLPNGAPYIVMELLEGEDLASALARRGPLPVHEVVASVTDACEALAEAHALGIVHRDLKPANIFLARRPAGPPRVKVLDFGISKSTAADAPKGLTNTTALIGTPLYMSPEQLREARNVDGRTDIWALGAMMYELLAGVPPFMADGLTELCVLIMTGTPTPLSRHRPDVSPELEAIVNCCLEKNPAARFATAAALATALSGVARALAANAAHATHAAHAAPPPAGLATPYESPGLATEAVAARARAQAPTQAERPAPDRLPMPAPPPGSPAPSLHGPSPTAATPMHPARDIARSLPTQGLPGRAPYGSPRMPPAHGRPAPAQPAPPATADPVSSTANWLPPKRPNVIGLLVVFVAVAGVGFYLLYSLIVRAPTEQGGATTASGATESSATVTASASSSSAPPGSALRLSPSSPLSASAQTSSSPPAPIGHGPAGAAPPPLALPPPVASPPAVAAPVPAPGSGNLAPIAKPPAPPPPGPGSLMPAARN